MKENKIPKVIHYCWFGRGEKSDIIKKCIDSWKKYAPDYKIIEWNEDNFDVNFCKRSEQAYNQKKWAFVADVARLKILYDYGGIYLDTDVELLRPLDDFFANNIEGMDSFFCFLNERFIGTGLGFGSVSQSACVKYLLDNYLNMEFDFTNGLFNRVCTQIETEALEDYYDKFERNDYTQNFGTEVIFLSTSSWSSYLVHYGTGTWVEGGRDNTLKLKRDNKLGYKIRHVIRNPKIFKFIRQKFGYKSTYIYEFITYDLFDMGFLYFFKRQLKKMRRRLK